MKSDPFETTFASLRWFADDLDPKVVTDAVGHEPTLAYRIGETYRRSRGRDIVGRTGLWLLDTRDLVASSRLADHLDFLTAVLTGRPDLPEKIRRMMADHGYGFDASCFWAGIEGAEPDPTEDFRRLVERLGGTLETDFQADAAAGPLAAE